MRERERGREGEREVREGGRGGGGRESKRGREKRRRGRKGGRKIMRGRNREERERRKKERFRETKIFTKICLSVKFEAIYPQQYKTH